VGVLAARARARRWAARPRRPGRPAAAAAATGSGGGWRRAAAGRPRPCRGHPCALLAQLCRCWPQRHQIAITWAGSSYAVGRLLMQSPAPVCTVFFMAGGAAADGDSRQKGRRPARPAPAGVAGAETCTRGFAAGEPGSCGVAGTRERSTAATARCIT